jgi:hypothetical protein
MRLTSGIRRGVMRSCEDVLRALAGEGQMERVWAEVEVAGPLGRATARITGGHKKPFHLPRVKIPTTVMEVVNT